MKQEELEKDLREIVGERLTVSPFERWFYTNDLIPLPSWIKRLFWTTPAAVVKPKTAAEVAAV